MKQRLGELGWMLCLAGLPWSFFIIRLLEPFKHLDTWHANTLWMSCWIPVLASLHAKQGRLLARVPQSCWWLICWVSLITLWLFNMQSQSGHPYPAPLLMPLLHLWSILLALLLMASWTLDELQMILTAIYWSGVGLVVYGWLQVFNLDQFFKWVDSSKTTDTLAGTLSNPTHFACQLALWLPLIFLQPMRRRWILLPTLGLLYLSHSSIALACVALFLTGWLWQKRWQLGVWMGSFWTLVGIWMLRSSPEWLNVHGRWDTWIAWWQAITIRPILGWGLGFVKQASQQLPMGNTLGPWRHLHNEYYQWWVETGCIGLALMGWMLWQLWQRRRQTVSTPLRQACGWSLILCCLMAVLNFPFHLWQLGGWGLMAGAGWLVCTQKVMA